MAYDMVQTATGGLMFRDEASSAVGTVALTLTWAVNRAATNTQTVGTLPANAKIIDMYFVSPVASNAATTANASIGLSGGSATAFCVAQDLKTAIGNFRQTPTAAWAPSAAKQDITCTYTETGAASTAGTATGVITYCVL